jgi:hypothetical protein
MMRSISANAVGRTGGRLLLVVETRGMCMWKVREGGREGGRAEGRDMLSSGPTHTHTHTHIYRRQRQRRRRRRRRRKRRRRKRGRKASRRCRVGEQPPSPALAPHVCDFGGDAVEAASQHQGEEREDGEGREGGKEGRREGGREGQDIF